MRMCVIMLYWRETAGKAMKRPRAIALSSDSDSDSEGQLEQKSSHSRAKSGAATYLSSFKDSWSKEWPFIRKGTTVYHFWCDVCRAERSCGHQGRRDVERHVLSSGNQEKVRALKSSHRIPQYFTAAPTVDSMTLLEAKTRRAEVKVVTALAKHSVPLAFAEHLSPLLHEIFPDSEIAKAYGSGKAKTAYIINGALKPYCQQQLVQKMKNMPFCLSIDGSNNTGTEKMNPMTVKLFDVNCVQHRFLDMCTTAGSEAAMTETIFSKMDSVLTKHGVPWKNCISLSVYNTSVNMGITGADLYKRGG